jgi:prophage regulatory protein
MSKLLRLGAVIEMTGLSRSTIYSDPHFPRPVKIGSRAVAWVAAELEDWCAARINERDLA